MNKIIVLISFLLTVFFINRGISEEMRRVGLKTEISQLKANNLDMKEKIKLKEFLPKEPPVLFSEEYGLFLNQLRCLQNDSGIMMSLELDGASDKQDIAGHYEDTEYKGIRGLKIKIRIDRFPKETDMGTILDDIHLLERNTDFKVLEIDEDDNNLTVKGEVYGL